MTSIIAIDLETTGLDPERDTIIEIGAIRFNGKRVEEEFTTLINPGRHIPEFITGLTGIEDSMLRSAPRLRDVLPELQDFVGAMPILGHNIRFDLSFLQRYGLFQLNEVIDTYELASVLLPSASRYNLGALGQQLGILLPASHRALDDARLTHAVYLRLFDLAASLPLDLLAEIVRLSEPIEWDARWAFQQILRARAKEGLGPRRVHHRLSGSLPGPGLETGAPPLKPRDPPLGLDVEETAAILEYGGPFSEYFEAYEFRAEQVEMLRAVTDALSQGYHLMVEAGTGVGKSFAYLSPAALYALQNNTRVVISTNTINLQDQLIKKDIPDLAAALGLDLRAAVLKGRANYLCPRRLEYLRHHPPQTAEEMRVLAKVLVWLLENQSGDRSEINLNGSGERDIWLRLSAEDDACTGETCIKRTGGTCPFYCARLAAQNAHLLVVNHALLLSDLVTGARLLPDYDRVIIDEAHHLESAATNALSFRFTLFDLERMLRELGSSGSGLLSRLLTDSRNAVRPSDFGLLAQKVERATDLAFRLQNQGREFFQTLSRFAEMLREGRPVNNYAWQERILAATRAQPGWDEVEAAWGLVDETWGLLLKLLAELHEAAADLYADGAEALEDVLGDIGSLYRRMSEADNKLNQIISQPAANQVYWLEIHPNGNRLTLYAAPLQVGPILQKHLWNEKSSAILTSATLTTHGEFSYMRRTLGTEDANELSLGSPFDYENAALLFLASDIPEPNQPGYQQNLENALIQLCLAAGGRTLVLFTSYAQLKRTSQAISGALARADIAIYEQGEGASPNTLIESFKGSERAVLLGTRSFWEGVDIPGEALSVVVIPKLPFDVPTDPLIAARSELYEDPFNEYYLPEAILKFRQGFGRLIRTQSDRGLVAVLDRRLQTKQYGRLFLESLPPCTLKIAPLASLPQIAARWLGV